MATSGSSSEPRSAPERSTGDARAGGSASHAGLHDPSHAYSPVDATTLEPSSRLGRLWQFPLLLISLSLFGYAGYRLIDPQPGPTIDQQLDAAAKLLRDDRADAATEVLRAVLLEAEKKPLTDPQRGRTNLYLAEAVDRVQRTRKLDVPANHQRIIDYSKAAEASGSKLSTLDVRRMAESYEALGKPVEALAAYRRAMETDTDKAPALRRKVIDLLVARNQPTEAEAEIKIYLADARLTQSERSWAIGEQSRLLVDRLMFAAARDLLAEAIKHEKDPTLLGQFHYRLGYCDWKLGDDASAERYLRLARNQLLVNQPEDADAALLLGRILVGRRQWAEAISFFNAVIVSHPDSAAAIPARIGRGLSRIEAGVDTAEAGMADLTSAVADITAKASRDGLKPEAVRALVQAGRVATSRQDFKAALELLALEQTLEPAPSADFFARMSRVYEQRAQQLERALKTEPEGPNRVKQWQQWRDTLVRAADAAVAHSRGMTVDDDIGYGEALWRGIDLYDRAGSLSQAIGALELFVAERPADPLTPDALLRLGKAYHAAGQFDRAIEAFKRNQFRYERTLAAQKSGVPLAKSYIAKGPASYAKAEEALHATLQSPLLTPDADEFRQALLELAELYYRTSRFEEAVAKLEELTARYPKDERTGQLYFLMADSYRKSANLLAATNAATTQPTTRPATGPAVEPALATTPQQQQAIRQHREAARQDRLTRARRLYDGALDHYRVAAPKSELDQLYFKLAHFYRADCVYDVGNFEEAIRLYDTAALRFQDDPSALTAYVQIVNAYAALGKPDDARTAAERARWLLQRMPAASFKEAQRSMPQAAWENWVKWTKQIDATAGTKDP